MRTGSDLILKFGYDGMFPEMKRDEELKVWFMENDVKWPEYSKESTVNYKSYIKDYNKVS